MTENYAEKRRYLRRLVKTYYDLQHNEIKLMNRMGITKDKDKNGNYELMNRETTFIGEEKEYYANMLTIIQSQIYGTKQANGRYTNGVEQVIKQALKQWLVYTEHLKNIKGVGWLMGAIICSEYDITIATTVSKMWQYTGLNPNVNVCGKKTKVKKDGTYEITITDTLIRGDKLTPGFNSPYNIWLRTKMIGVLGSSFIKQKDSKYRKIYDDIKLRYQNKPHWKDESKGHIHNASVRYMVKIFIQDLYDAWRKIEGLEVRLPYAEEKLGIVHSK